MRIVSTIGFKRHSNSCEIKERPPNTRAYRIEKFNSKISAVKLRAKLFDQHHKGIAPIAMLGRIYWSMNQSIDQSINQSVIQSINWSINLFIFSSINTFIHSIAQSFTNLYTPWSTHYSTYQSINPLTQHSITPYLTSHIYLSIHPPIYSSS